jgi:hypothetical protein
MHGFRDSDSTRCTPDSTICSFGKSITGGGGLSLVSRKYRTAAKYVFIVEKAKPVFAKCDT